MSPTRIPRPLVPVLAVVACLAIGLTLVGTASAVSQSGDSQTVEYHGYRAEVPASWPVYDLEASPTTCVRFDRHAVYLGHPGETQLCAGRPIGRTEALLIEPADPETVDSVAAAVDPEPNFGMASAVVGDVVVTVSYGENRESVLPYLKSQEQIEESRPVAPEATEQTDPKAEAAAPDADVELGEPVEPAQSTESAQSTEPAQSAESTKPAEPAAESTEPAAPTESTQSTEPAAETAEVPVEEGAADRPAAPRAMSAALTTSPPPVGSRGFDACTAPSIETMRKWWPDPAPYSVVNIYIGGMSRACSQRNLTAEWVKRASAMEPHQGWTFIPTYVGRQAPCTGFSARMSTNVTTARAQARDEADDAVEAMRHLGFGAGNPIYLDIESYPRGSSCTSLVLNYVSAWTERLHQLGYYSGVYSSASTGIRDLGLNYSNRNYLRPDAIWNAHWDGVPDPYNSDRYIADSLYKGKRIKQYRGGHNERWGGVTLNIDSNVVDGPVALPGTRSTRPTATPAPKPSVSSGASGWSSSAGKSLGGHIIGAPAAAWQTSTRLDVVARGTNRQVYYKYANGSSWSGWRHLGGVLTSDPAIVSWDSGRLDVFGRGTDGALWHTWYDNGHWYGWQRLGGRLIGAPAVMSQRPGQLDVFVRGTDNRLYQKTWDGRRWTSFESRGGRITSAPTVQSWSNGRLDVFARGADRALWHRAWTSSHGWYGWETRGGRLIGGPSAVTGGSGKLDVYARGADRSLWHRTYASGWNGWQGIGGRLTSDPAAIAPRSDRVDVFYRGSRGELRYRWYEG